ncbi:MAG: hypothetical protein E7031_01385 [Akkermansiaceae bacterium]|nr:hypothetical protein [Akkermansiaceae bacterium]
MKMYKWMPILAMMTMGAVAADATDAVLLPETPSSMAFAEDYDNAEDEDNTKSSKKKKKAKKDKKSKKRNVGKAAQQKRKELRDKGVRNVRAKSPSGWPDKIPVPEDTTLKQGEKQGQFFVYETNNYIFFTPVEIDENACETVGRLFECAYAANQAVGEVLPVPRTEEEREGKKFRVELWPTKQQYVAQGGSPTSAGVFMFSSRKMPGDNGPITAQTLASDKVMVPFESLGLSADGHVAKNDIDTHVLVHELTHQNFVYNGLPIWCNEGWAEYVGYVPYVGEDLDFSRCYSVILHKAKEQSSHGALDFPFTLEEFLTMDQQQMYSYMGQGKDTYTLATMIITFYVHLDGKKGVEALKKYMQALIDGESHEEAAKHLIAPHKNAEKLQKDFIKAWKSKKVPVSFKDVD